MENEKKEKCAFRAYAENELKYVKWGDLSDGFQKEFWRQAMEMLNIVSKANHSGSSLPYLLSIFDRLVRFKPLTDLTFSDDEWREIGDGCFQNKRDSEVFKDGADGAPYKTENGQRVYLGEK